MSARIIAKRVAKYAKESISPAIFSGRWKRTLLRLDWVVGFASLAGEASCGSALRLVDDRLLTLRSPESKRHF